METLEPPGKGLIFTKIGQILSKKHELLYDKWKLSSSKLNVYNNCVPYTGYFQPHY